MEKPKIQYIGQFYIHGSVAKKVDIRKQFRMPKTTLPLFRPNNTPVRYVEPVAIISLVLVAVLVLTMGLGLLRIQKDWEAYEQMKNHASNLRAENAELTRQYRDAYDLAVVESKALGLGLVPVDTVKHITVTITPAPHIEPPELTWVQEMTLFWTNLWA